MWFISPLDSGDKDTNMTNEDLPLVGPDSRESSSDELIPQLDDDNEADEDKSVSQTIHYILIIVFLC